MCRALEVSSSPPPLSTGDLLWVSTSMLDAARELQDPARCLDLASTALQAAELAALLDSHSEVRSASQCRLKSLPAACPTCRLCQMASGQAAAVPPQLDALSPKPARVCRWQRRAVPQRAQSGLQQQHRLALTAGRQPAGSQTQW